MKNTLTFSSIIYWFYSGNLKQNIAEMDFTTDRMDMTEAQRFHAHFQYLKNLKKDSLIIIDNFNVLPKEDPMLKELMQYDFSILVTTRCKLTAFPVFEIKELDTEKELLPLFGNICPYENEETDTIHNIIDTVHAHTLTVCLSALSMSASGISPSDLFDELKSCGTDIVSGEDVELYKDGEFSEGLMIEHLKKLLRITNLTEEQQSMISYCPTTFFAYVTKSLPASVNEIPFLLLSKINMPISSSKSRILAESAGCETNNFAEASRIDAESAMVSTYFSCTIFIGNLLFSPIGRSPDHISQSFI